MAVPTGNATLDNRGPPKIRRVPKTLRGADSGPHPRSCWKPGREALGIAKDSRKADGGDEGTEPCPGATQRGTEPTPPRFGPDPGRNITPYRPGAGASRTQGRRPANAGSSRSARGARSAATARVRDRAQPLATGRILLSGTTGQPRDSGCRDRVRSRARVRHGRSADQLWKDAAAFLSPTPSLGPCARPMFEAGAGTPAFWARYVSCKWRPQHWSCSGCGLAGVNRRGPGGRPGVPLRCGGLNCGRRKRAVEGGDEGGMRTT